MKHLRMACEDQLILLEIFKGDVARYAQTVKALKEARTLTIDEFLRRFDIAKNAFQSALTVRRSLHDHIQVHGCTLQSEVLSMGEF